jgi:hypothetical protein
MSANFIEWSLFFVLFALVLVFALSFLPWGKTQTASEDDRQQDDAAIDSIRGELTTWDKAYARRRVRAGTGDAPTTPT